MVSRSTLASLALALFCCHLAVSAVWILQRTAGQARLAVHAYGEPLEAKQARLFGTAYTGAVAAIRRTIPEDDPYLLVDAGEDTGAVFWVRFDLAPRRALLLGKLEEIRKYPRLGKHLPRGARWVVIAYPTPGIPPAVLDRSRFLRENTAPEGAGR
jgi:hypothetical protein